jgi:hydrogenase expression/formation protein HypE
MKTVVMGHGSGGALTEQIIRMARVAFGSSYLDQGLDSALLPDPGGSLAFTTDSFVVRPLFFPGGDIGKLAVCGTVNDLAVVGARPRYLSCGLIMEEGLPMDELEKILASMGEAAKEAGVEIVTGDTKVVERGRGDGIYINTAGIGLSIAGVDLSGSGIKAGDSILVSGSLGDHAMSLLCARGELGFQSSLSSDCAPLNGLISALLDSGARVRFMRDLTRGGLAACLHELAELRGCELEVEEERLPITSEVRALSELLGIEVPSMANEGKIMAIVAPSDEARALSALRSHPYGRQAAAIGHVSRVDAAHEEPAPAGGRPGPRPARVLMRTIGGATRILARPSGEKLPRIC